eukprot:TRINITY_DN1053_c0_g3_i1.p1 TRINITY_DN1053_c0_g3~~TRINITY_DN1053_c0_g3_i1.p1  ORF type:complete len:247 (-),score=22.75 TRINITY_DN1053_c0_g3_i1:398-1138(-)
MLVIYMLLVYIICIIDSIGAQPETCTILTHRAKTPTPVEDVGVVFLGGWCQFEQLAEQDELRSRFLQYLKSEFGFDVDITALEGKACEASGDVKVSYMGTSYDASFFAFSRDQNMFPTYLYPAYGSESLLQSGPYELSEYGFGLRFTQDVYNMDTIMTPSGGAYFLGHYDFFSIADSPDEEYQRLNIEFKSTTYTDNSNTYPLLLRVYAPQFGSGLFIGGNDIEVLDDGMLVYYQGSNYQFGTCAN